MTKQIFNIGWPSGILHLLFQLGSMVLFMIIGALPENKIEIMAAFTNGLKIESAIFLPAFAFNMANSVVVGNLLGQKKDEEAVRNGVVTALMGVIIVSIMTVVIMINARLIAGVLSDNINVVNECTRYIYIALLAEPIMAWGVILSGGLNGAGDTKSVMLIAGAGIWLVRIPLCYILGVHFALGAAAVWWSMNASILVQSGLMTVRYFRKKWIVHT